MKNGNKVEFGKTDTRKVWLLDYPHTVECQRRRKLQFYVGPSNSCLQKINGMIV
jgi:hypothetical protein